MRLIRILIGWMAMTLAASLALGDNADSPLEVRGTPLEVRGTPPGLHSGVFVVAREQMHDPRFRQTVVLITQHGRQGALGLIINRPSSLTLTQALPDLSALRSSSERLYLGGPVEPHDLFFLTQGQGTEALQPVLENLHFGSGIVALDQAIRAAATGSEVRAYAGYAGWAPGQLEKELARGDWLLVPADPQAVFSAHPERLWTELVRTWSGLWL